MNAPLPAALALEADHRARRQTEVVAALGPVLPRHALLWHREDTTPYECDGLTAYREQPLVVALPETEGADRRGAARVPSPRTCRSSHAAPAPASRAARCRIDWA